MKSNNSRLRAINSAYVMLHTIALAALQASATAKKIRQEKRRLNRSGWSPAGSGTRECARRRQQVAYDAGLVSRRALPQA